MALYSNYIPTVAMQARRRNLQVSGFNKFRLNWSGYKEDGSLNARGYFYNNIVPHIAAAASTYFLGSPQLGYAVGEAANRIREGHGKDIFAGTNTSNDWGEGVEGNRKSRNVASSWGGAIGSIYTAAGGKTYDWNKGSTGTDNVAEALSGSGGKDMNKLVQQSANALAGAFNQQFSQSGPLDYQYSPSDYMLQESSWNDQMLGPSGQSFIGSMENRRPAIQSTLPNSFYGQPYQSRNPFFGTSYFARGGETRTYTPMPTEMALEEERRLSAKPDNTSVEQPRSPQIAIGPQNSETLGSVPVKAYQYLVNKGMPKTVAAGFIGNLVQESSLIPTRAHDQGTGYGIAGWRDPSPGVGRKTALMNYLKSRGASNNDLYAQLDFLFDEAMQRGDIQRAASAASPQSAALILSQRYFRPNAKHANNNRRQQLAATIFNYKNGGEVMKRKTPFQFFRCGGEPVPGNFNQKDLSEIREFLDIMPGEHVSKFDAQTAMNLSREGYIRVEDKSFNGQSASVLAQALYEKPKPVTVVSSPGYGGQGIQDDPFAIQRSVGRYADPKVGTSMPNFGKWAKKQARKTNFAFFS